MSCYLQWNFKHTWFYIIWQARHMNNVHEADMCTDLFPFFSRILIETHVYVPAGWVPWNVLAACNAVFTI